MYCSNHHQASASINWPIIYWKSSPFCQLTFVKNSIFNPSLPWFLKICSECCWRVFSVTYWGSLVVNCIQLNLWTELILEHQWQNNPLILEHHLKRICTLKFHKLKLSAEFNALKLKTHRPWNVKMQAPTSLLVLKYFKQKKKRNTLSKTYQKSRYT